MKKRSPSPMSRIADGNPFIETRRGDRIRTAFGPAETMPLVGGIVFRCYEPPLLVDGVEVEAYGAYSAATGRRFPGDDADRFMARIAGTDYAPPALQDRIDQEFSRLARLYAQAYPWLADHAGLKAIERTWPDTLPRYEDLNDDPWLGLSGTRYVERHRTDHGTVVVGIDPEGMTIKVACGRQRGVPAIVVDGKPTSFDLMVRFDAEGRPAVYDRFAHIHEMAGNSVWHEGGPEDRSEKAGAGTKAKVIALALAAASAYAGAHLPEMKLVATEAVDRAASRVSHEMRSILRAQLKGDAPGLEDHYGRLADERRKLLGELAAQRLLLEVMDRPGPLEEVTHLD